MLQRIKNLLWLFSRTREYVYIDGGDMIAPGKNISSVSFILYYNKNGRLDYCEPIKRWSIKQ